MGYQGDVLIMVTDDTPLSHVERIKRMDDTVIIYSVQKISARNAKDKSLLSMLTKLQLWSLVQYEQVIYFDSDFIFLKNPESAFYDCGESEFCACGDTGIKSYYGNRYTASNYFNSGFMVIRPSLKQYEYLKSYKHVAENTAFVDQDMLNNIYQNKWKQLDSKYNVMHVSGAIDSSIVAIHEKLWVMKQKYPLGNFIWNNSENQIQAIKSHVNSRTYERMKISPYATFKYPKYQLNNPRNIL